MSICVRGITRVAGRPSRRGAQRSSASAERRRRSAPTPRGDRGAALAVAELDRDRSRSAAPSTISAGSIDRRRPAARSRTRSSSSTPSALAVAARHQRRVAPRLLRDRVRQLLEPRVRCEPAVVQRWRRCERELERAGWRRCEQRRRARRRASRAVPGRRRPSRREGACPRRRPCAARSSTRYRTHRAPPGRAAGRARACARRACSAGERGEHVDDERDLEARAERRLPDRERAVERARDRSRSRGRARAARARCMRRRSRSRTRPTCSENVARGERVGEAAVRRGVERIAVEHDHGARRRGASRARRDVRSASGSSSAGAVITEPTLPSA